MVLAAGEAALVVAVRAEAAGEGGNQSESEDATTMVEFLTGSAVADVRCSLGDQRERVHAHRRAGHHAHHDAPQRRRVVDPHHRLEGAAEGVSVALLAVLFACRQKTG